MDNWRDIFFWVFINSMFWVTCWSNLQDPFCIVPNAVVSKVAAYVLVSCAILSLKRPFIKILCARRQFERFGVPSSFLFHQMEALTRVVSLLSIEPGELLDKARTVKEYTRNFPVDGSRWVNGVDPEDMSLIDFIEASCRVLEKFVEDELGELPRDDQARCEMATGIYAALQLVRLMDPSLTMNDIIFAASTEEDGTVDHHMLEVLTQLFCPNVGQLVDGVSVVNAFDRVFANLLMFHSTMEQGENTDNEVRREITAHHFSNLTYRCTKS